jgi:hypothetical protein
MDRRSVLKLGLGGLAFGAAGAPAAFGQAKMVLKAAGRASDSAIRR